VSAATASSAYGEALGWEPEQPQFKPLHLLISWLLTGVALWFAAIVLPGVTVVNNWDALLMAAVVAILNAVLPPLLAALRLPFMIALGFILILILNALVLLLGSRIIDGSYEVDNFGWALLAALVVAAVSVVLEVIFATNDNDAYTLRVVQRIARRQGGGQRTDVPGIIYLEIDGLALPVLQRAMRGKNEIHISRHPGNHLVDRAIVQDPGPLPCRFERAMNIFKLAFMTRADRNQSNGKKARAWLDEPCVTADIITIVRENSARLNYQIGFGLQQSAQLRVQ
jgi:uncharacterized membrane protein YvlD (DUF360 family)